MRFLDKPCKSSGGHYYGPISRVYQIDAHGNQIEIPPNGLSTITYRCVYCGCPHTINKPEEPRSHVVRTSTLLDSNLH